MTDEEAAAIMGCTVDEAREHREKNERWVAEQEQESGRSIDDLAADVFAKLEGR